MNWEIPKHPLAETAMWRVWEQKVRAALPFFCANMIYVRQDNSEAEFEQVAASVAKQQIMFVPDLQTADAEFGGRVVNTAIGPVTRMWLDSNVEINFLRRNLSQFRNLGLEILEIGAGYGRLAAMMRYLNHLYTCVDAVPISTFLCDYYLRRFDGNATVLTLADFVDRKARGKLKFDLAINVHSWSECSFSQIEEWLQALDELQVQWLFTVPHNSLWQSWGGPSFRLLIEKEYELMAEEFIGFEKCPHALWRRK